MRIKIKNTVTRSSIDKLKQIRNFIIRGKNEKIDKKKKKKKKNELF
jgi:hypothetical protein